MTAQPLYQIDLTRTANEPIAEGIHPFVISNIIEGESQNGGNPMWTVELTCLTPGEESKTVNLYLVLTQAARWKFEQFLDAVGAPTSGTVTAPQFINKRFRAQISHEDYNGRPQARIGQMWAMTSGAAAAAATKPTVTPKAVAAPAGKPAAAAPKPVGAKATATVGRQPKLPTDAVQPAEGDIPF